MNSPRTLAIYAGLSLATLVAFTLSLISGSVSLGARELWRGVIGADELAHTLIFELRLPRALTAFAAGGALSLAGALMQVLLRNPLADPFVMGVSGGAAVAALAAMLVGASSGLSVGAAATLGALGATLLVFALARGEGGWTPTRLLLTGVVIAAGASAVVSILLSLGDETRLRSMLFWLMGDLALSGPPGPLLTLCLASLALSAPFARQLNVLAHSELQARILGAPVDSLRIGVFLASSLLTGVSVATVGTIGFVGLITPHLARLLLGADHRRMLPACVVLGGALVMLADLCARTLFAPRQLPVGALTALIGAPAFLELMRRSPGR